MRELDKVLDKNEKVFWEGKPQFGPFFMKGAIPTFLFGLAWTAIIAYVFYAVNFLPGGAASQPGNMGRVLIVNLFLLPFILVGLWLLIGVQVRHILNYRNVYYTITDKRVIVQSGVIGRDFNYIDFDKITNAEVVVGFWDKLLGKNSGDILVFSTNSLNYISSISDPYSVFRFFKKVSHDVKTDIQFPNKYRPSQNPGYNSKYKTK